MVKKAKKQVLATIKKTRAARWFVSLKRWQKGLLVGGGALLVLLAGGATAAYITWLHDAERTVADSLMKAFTAPSMGVDGTIKIAAPASTTTVSLKTLGNATHGQLSAVLKVAAPLSTSGADLAVQGDLVYAGDVLYFKIHDTEKLYNAMLEKSLLLTTETVAAQSGKTVEALRDEIRQQYQTLVHPLIEQLADKWVEVSPEDVTGSAHDIKQELACVQAIAGQAANDEAAASEVRRLYENHRFLAVGHRLSDDKDTIGYAVTLKTQQLHAFGKALGKTKVFAAADVCKQTTDDSRATADKRLDDVTSALQSDSGSFELRMSKDSHQLRSIVYKADKTQNGAKTTTELTAAFTFGQSVSDQAPSNTIPFREVKATLDGIGLKARAAQQ